jgi:hypothetical protein
MILARRFPSQSPASPITTRPQPLQRAEEEGYRAVAALWAEGLQHATAVPRGVEMPVVHSRPLRGEQHQEAAASSPEGPVLQPASLEMGVQGQEESPAQHVAQHLGLQEADVDSAWAAHAVGRRGRGDVGGWGVAGGGGVGQQRKR